MKDVPSDSVLRISVQVSLPVLQSAQERYLHPSYLALRLHFHQRLVLSQLIHVKLGETLINGNGCEHLLSFGDGNSRFSYSTTSESMPAYISYSKSLGLFQKAVLSLSRCLQL